MNGTLHIRIRRNVLWALVLWALVAIIVLAGLAVIAEMVVPPGPSPATGEGETARWTKVLALATVDLILLTAVLQLCANRLQWRSICAGTSLALLHEWNHDLWGDRAEAEKHVEELRELARRDPRTKWEDLRSKYPYAVKMSHFFDKVGYLVEAHLVDKELVTAAFKSSAKYWWEVLQPFITEEAKRRPDKKYQEYFRRLADC